MAATPLDNPPPLTPARFRNWPYALAPFPFSDLQRDAGLNSVGREKSAEPTNDDQPAKVE